MQIFANELANHININLFGSMSVNGPTVNIDVKAEGIVANQKSDIVINAGEVNIISDTASGINNYYSGDNAAVLTINGGELDITSATGGTNITNVKLADGLDFTEGSALSQSGHIVIDKKTEALAPVLSPEDAALPTEEKTEEIIKETKIKPTLHSKKKVATPRKSFVYKAYTAAE